MLTEELQRENGITQKTILLVEDEAVIALIEKNILEKYGYEVITASSGEKAVKIVESGISVDLILMDINLEGGMDGTDAAEQILKKRDLPLIFLSSHTEREVVEKTEGITSYGYIVKNSGETVLIASVKMAFRLFEARMKEIEKEKALRKSEEKFKTLFYSASDGIFLMQNTVIIECNDRALSLLGRTREQIIGLTPWDISPPFQPDGTNSEEKARGIIEDVFNGSYREFEWQHTKANGEMVDVEVSVNTTCFEKNTYLATLRDITHKIKARRELKESEELLRGIAQNIPGVVFQFKVDENGKYGFNFISDNAKKYIGLSNNNLDDFFERFVEQLPAEEVNDFVSSVQEAINNLSVWKYEGRYILPDGEEKYFRGTSEPRKVGGQILFDGVLLDITESKQAEIELEDTKSLLATSVTQTPIPMVVASAPDFIVRLANKAAADILGVEDESEYIGKSLLDIDPPWQDLDKQGNPIPLSEMPLSLALQGIETKNKEYCIKRKDGTLRWDLVNSSTIRNKAGDIIAAYIVFPDITEQKLAEEKLRKTVQEKEMLLKSMANAFVMWETVLEDNKVVDVRFSYINEAYEKLAGFKLEEVRGKRIMEVWPETERSWFDIFSDIIRTGDSKFFEKFFTPTNSFYACNAYLPWGTPDRVCVVFEDITERKKAEIEFRQLANLHETVLDTVSMGLLYVIENVVQWTNSAFNKMYGYDEVEIIGKHADFFYKNKEEYDRIKDEAIREASKVGVYAIKLETIHKNGSAFWVQMSGKAVNPEKPDEGSIWMLQDITEKKKAEDELIKNQKLLSNSQRIALIGSFEVDLVNNVHSWNKELFDIYGYNYQEVQASGEAFEKLIHPEDREIFETHHQNFLNKGGFGDVVCRIIRPDGETRYLSFAGETSVDEKGKPLYLIGVVQDVTESKMAELAVKTSEMILHATIDSINDGLLIVDSDGRITHSNNRFKQIFSIPDELLATRNDENLINYVKKQLTDPEHFIKQVEEIYKTTEITENVLRFSDGRIIERRSYPLMEDSPIKGRAWIFRDITEQKQNEEYLKMFKYSIDKSMDAVIWLNDKGGFDYANEQTCKSLGYTHEELMELDLFDIDPFFSRERFDKEWARYQHDRKEGGIHIETFQKRKDGTLFPVEVVSKHSWIGDMELHVAHMRDITERKQAEENLRASEKLFRTVFEMATVGIVQVTPEGRIVTVNSRFCEIVGYTKSELYRLTFRDITHPDDLDLEDGIITQILTGEVDSYEIEKRYFRKDGHVVWAEIFSKVIRNEKNEILYVFAAVTDITERKQSEEILKKNEFFLNRSQEVGLIGSFILEIPEDIPELQTWQSSPMMETIFGIDANYPKTGESWLELIVQRDEVLEYFSKQISGSRNIFEKEYQIVRPVDKKLRWIFGRGEFEYDDHGTHIRLIGTVQDITDRKMAEERIRRLSRIFEDSLNEIYLFEADTLRFIEMNKAAEENLGYRPDEYEQLTPLDIEPLIMEEMFNDLIAPLRTGEKEQVVFETVHQRKDKSLYDVEVHLQLLKYEPKSLFMGIILDISDRKEAEKEIREREKNFALAQMLADIGSWKYDIITGEVYWSEGLYRIFGIDSDSKLELKQINEWIHPDDRDIAREKLGNAVKHGESFEIEYRFYRADGEERYLRGIGKVEQDNKGNNLFVYGTAQDITGFKKAEERLKESYEIINKSPAIAFLWRNDFGWPVEYVSENVKNLFGYSAEDFMTGKIAYADLLHPDDMNRVAAEVLKHSKVPDKTTFFQEYRIITKKGDVKWLDDHTWIRRSKTGDVTHYQGIVQDITERKQAEYEIQRQLTQKEVLLKEVHHRIKNHIASIGSLLSLQSQSIASEELRTIFQETIGRISSMRVLYDKLLVSGEYKDVSIKSYLEGLIDIIMKVFPGSSQLRIEKHIDDFQIDSKRLFPIGVIINELLTNAIKYAFTGRDTGFIEITLLRNKNHVTLTIQDDGVGLPEGFNFSETKGFGLMLVEILCQQIDGNFSIKTQKGTRSILKFDL